MNIITRIAYRLRRLHLTLAEQDLAWMEAHAPAALHRQRQQVAAMRARLATTTTANDIAHRSTHRIKRRLLNL